MLLSLFLRLLRLVITSVICSLPIHLAAAGMMADKAVLFLSFIAFVIATGIDAYRFSFSFYIIQNYFLCQLLPLAIYIVMGFLTCLVFQPFVFNRIFLPLRFAGCFGMSTIESIAVIGIAFIVIVTVIRLIGARLGRLFDMWYEDE